jgi:hypothetical protein
MEATSLLFVMRGRSPARDVPKEVKTASTPACCNCHLAKVEKARPANYRRCRYTKHEMQKRKPQRTPKTTTRRVFFSNLATLDMSFGAALRGSTKQQHRPQTCQVAMVGPATMEPRVLCPYINTNSMQDSPLGLQM